MHVAHSLLLYPGLLASPTPVCMPDNVRNAEHSDERIVGFDPWPLNVPEGWHPLAGWTTPIVGLMGIPELYAEYVALGKAIIRTRARERDNHADAEDNERA